MVGSDDPFVLGRFGLFSGVNSLLVSGSVYLKNNNKDIISHPSIHPKKSKRWFPTKKNLPEETVGSWYFGFTNPNWREMIFGTIIWTNNCFQMSWYFEMMPLFYLREIPQIPKNYHTNFSIVWFTWFNDPSQKKTQTTWFLWTLGSPCDSPGDDFLQLNQLNMLVSTWCKEKENLVTKHQYCLLGFACWVVGKMKNISQIVV